jgi:hypothetical protein
MSWKEPGRYVHQVPYETHHIYHLPSISVVSTSQESTNKIEIEKEVPKIKTWTWLYTKHYAESTRMKRCVGTPATSHRFTNPRLFPAHAPWALFTSHLVHILGSDVSSSVCTKHDKLFLSLFLKQYSTTTIYRILTFYYVCSLCV